jgi:hypothetical protein
LRGRLATIPSIIDDEMATSIWLLVELRKQSKNFFCIIPNRGGETFTEVLRENIHDGTILVSDGHRSYVPAARDLGFQHLIVNHSVGFTNEGGDLTNSIENLWSHFRSYLRIRHGVLRSEMENLLTELKFRKIFYQRK